MRRTSSLGLGSFLVALAAGMGAACAATVDETPRPAALHSATAPTVEALKARATALRRRAAAMHRSILHDIELGLDRFGFEKVRELRRVLRAERRVVASWKAQVPDVRARIRLGLRIDAIERELDETRRLLHLLSFSAGHGGTRPAPRR